MYNTGWLERNRPALASAITSLTWVADGIDDTERQVVQGLVDIEVLFGTDSAPALVDKPWIRDGVDESDTSVISQLQDLAVHSRVDGELLVRLPFLDTQGPVDADVMKLLSRTAKNHPEIFQATVVKPWVMDGLDEHEFAVVEAIAGLAGTAEAAAALMVSLPFLDTAEASDVGTVNVLAALQSTHPQLFQAVLQNPGPGNDLGENAIVSLWALQGLRNETAGLEILESVGVGDATLVTLLVDLAARESELFNTVVDSLWFQDGVNDAEATLLQQLEILTDKEQAASLWIDTLEAWTYPGSFMEDSLAVHYDVNNNGIIEHNEALNAVADHSEDAITDDQLLLVVAHYGFSEGLIPTPPLMALVEASAWYQGGVDYDMHFQESLALQDLRKIAANDTQLARSVTNWFWVFDDSITEEEAYALEFLNKLDELAPEVAQLVIRFSWLADKVVIWEAQAVGDFYGLVAENQSDFAVELAKLPWIADDLTSAEATFGLGDLSWIASSPNSESSDPRNARQILGLTPNPPDLLDLRVINVMRRILVGNPDQFNRLLMEPWLVDGLDEKERIYLIAAGSTGETAKRLFDPYTIASKSIELPLAGPVNLWVVGHYQIDYQNTLEKMERAVRGTEGFWEIPFHTNHVIFYPLEPGRRGSHIGTVMYLDTVDGDVPELDMYLIVSYYHFARGPSWFRGGGSLVVQAFIFNNGNLPDPVSPSYCSEQGLDNLQALNDLRDRNPGFLWEWCNFSMGEHFLLTLRNVMGKDAWLSALRAFYLQYVRNYVFITYTGVPLGDEDVYHVFLEHTPPELVDDVKDVFRRLHGGPFIDQDG